MYPGSRHHCSDVEDLSPSLVAPVASARPFPSSFGGSSSKALELFALWKIESSLCHHFPYCSVMLHFAERQLPPCVLRNCPPVDHHSHHRQLHHHERENPESHHVGMETPGEIATRGPALRRSLDAATILDGAMVIQEASL